MHAQVLTAPQAAAVAAAVAAAYPREWPTNPADLLLSLRAAQLSTTELVLMVARSPHPAALGALAQITGAPTTLCPPRTHALDPATDRPYHSPPPRPRTPRFRDARRITYVGPNTRRPPSAAYARFAAYSTGITLTQAARRGATPADIRYDLARGHIRVSP